MVNMAIVEPHKRLCQYSYIWPIFVGFVWYPVFWTTYICHYQIWICHVYLCLFKVIFYHLGNMFHFLETTLSKAKYIGGNVTVTSHILLIENTSGIMPKSTARSESPAEKKAKKAKKTKRTVGADMFAVFLGPWLAIGGRWRQSKSHSTNTVRSTRPVVSTIFFSKFVSRFFEHLNLLFPSSTSGKMQVTFLFKKKRLTHTQFSYWACGNPEL